MQKLTDVQKQEAKLLAAQLQQLIENNFLKDPDENTVVQEEIKVIRTKLEEMGFIVSYKTEVNLHTLALRAEVTLYLPKQIH